MSVQELLTVLEKHQTDGFYVGQHIPQKKLQNAIAMFPIPLDIPVYGLIDTTVMGSCKIGLAFTSEGLIWKNDWTTKSPRSALSWDELLARKNDIKINSSDLVFGNDAIFNMAGSSMSRVAAFHMLHDVIRLLHALSQQQAIPQSSVVEVYPEARQQPVTYDQPTQQTISAVVDNSLYENALLSGLALMVAADGKVSDAAVDLAIAFIHEDEILTDKGKAIADFEAHLEKLLTQFERSSALFKLQAEKVIQLLGQIQDITHRNQLHIMLMGIYELDTKDKQPLATALWQKINNTLSG